VHLVPDFVKCWCLPLTKYVQNSKNRVKNKIVEKKQHKNCGPWPRPIISIALAGAGEKI